MIKTLFGKHHLSLIICLGEIGKVVLKLSKGESRGFHTLAIGATHSQMALGIGATTLQDRSKGSKKFQINKCSKSSENFTVALHSILNLFAVLQRKWHGK